MEAAGDLLILRATAPDEASLEQSARYAFAVLLDLTERAVGHALPMKLDY